MNNMSVINLSSNRSVDLLSNTGIPHMDWFVFILNDFNRNYLERGFVFDVLIVYKMVIGNIDLLNLSISKYKFSDKVCVSKTYDF